MIRQPKPIGGGVCELAITKGKCVLVNEGDAETVGMFNWHASASTAGRTCYAKAYVTGRSASYLHRVILCFPLLPVDHINGNGLDNRRQNLRLCSQHQNSCNWSHVPGGTSLFRGVIKVKNRWQVHISHKMKSIYVGSYTTELAAALAYDAEAYRLRGEFAILNFPPKNAS